MKYLLYFTLVFFFSCNYHDAPKPKIFVDEDVMINIMYDLTIIQAIKSSGDHVLSDNSLDVKSILNNKYRIDEKTWIANNKYYASNLRKYNLMVKEVHKRLEKQKFDIEQKAKNLKTKN